jgi:Na+-transporting methylmalonyl-CoA/oxaloacetate decarboxylase gamma subunit
MSSELVIAGIGVLITFSTFLAVAIWKGGESAGRLESRVTELERWRGNVRDDLHEVSDQLTVLVSEVKALVTLVEERTERRLPLRKEN